ncbi:cation:proton antiporter domain-containing protein [Methylomarinum vadi]|uniref:cation:proton antiporter domain-containing protein n=1 Tax=Methylomarinum vadi TaxID=438855 RepID=UPI0004DFA29F|nr:cation:proton antiporter [Methylomarinum vadi]
MPAVPEFFRVFLGGIAVGVLIAIPTSELMVKLYHEDLAIPVVFSIVIPYLCFVLAEHAFQVSGVMAVLTAAICLNATGLMRLSAETTEAVYTTWDVIVLICNSLLFLLIGMSIDIITLAHYWEAILYAVVAVAIARAISVYLFLPMTTKLFKFPAIDISSQHIMWWGGLKGGLAIAIVLTIPDSLPAKPLLFELTLGVVLVSLLMNASTIRYLISWLKIDTLTFPETVELRHNLERVNTAVDAVLHQFSQMHLLDKEIKHTIGNSMQKELEINIKELTPSQRLEFVRKNAIHAEREELEFLHDIGLLNYYTYLTYRDLLHHDLERSFEELQQLKKKTVPKKNIFIRMEWRIIQLLGQYDWTQPILIKYQKLRFANKVQHNIAGVLMAHAGLKVIKEYERSLDLFQYYQLKKVYQNRLRSRQMRLLEFSKYYSDFYHQYDYLLFQKIALKYSLRLINEEHEAGKVSTKVYKRIDERLRVALKKLPIVKAVLSLNRRDDWINNVPFFQGLPEQELKKMAGSAQYINFLPGDNIFHQGDKGHSVYILVGGRLDVYKRNRHGEQEHLAELREGCVVGVHALLQDTRRSATVKAKTHATLLRLSVKDIGRLSKILPELQHRLRIIDSERIENVEM